MRLSLLRVDLLPDVFDFHRIRANHDRCEICVDNISDDSRCERVMRFAVAGDAIFVVRTRTTTMSFLIGCPLPRRGAFSSRNDNAKARTSLTIMRSFIA
jgi:hypothetical protein